MIARSNPQRQQESLDDEDVQFVIDIQKEFAEGERMQLIPEEVRSALMARLDAEIETGGDISDALRADLLAVMDQAEEALLSIEEEAETEPTEEQSAQAQTIADGHIEQQRGVATLFRSLSDSASRKLNDFAESEHARGEQSDIDHWRDVLREKPHNTGNPPYSPAA